MKEFKRYFRRGEWVFIVVCATLSVALTLWYPFSSYFLVDAEVEQVSLELDSGAAFEWNLNSAELRYEGGDDTVCTKFSGTIFVRSEKPLLIRRIQNAPITVSLPEGCELTIREPGLVNDGQLKGTLPATLVVQLGQEDVNVLPFSGNLVVGRSPLYVQSQIQRPILLSGRVEIQARALDGRAVLQSVDQKMYMGDSLSFKGALNGNGLLRITDDDPGMRLFYAVNAKQAAIQRFGSLEPILVQSSLIQRITGDNILALIWGSFVGLAGILLFRRSLLEKK